MKRINTTDLTAWLASGKDHVLIDVRPVELFEHKHIPGAHCVPLEVDDFESTVVSFCDGDKQRKVIVYDSGAAYERSSLAAQRLERAGFRRVFEDESGILGSETAGQALVRGV